MLVGDLDPDRAVDDTSAVLSGWPDRESSTVPTALPLLSGGELKVVDRPGSAQSQIRICAQAVPRSDPRYPALHIANTVFGGYFSSRLVENIREDKGYAYSIDSGFSSTFEGSTLFLAMDVANGNTAPALLETMYEAGRISLIPPEESEVEAARHYASGSLNTWMGVQSYLATSLSNISFLGLDIHWLYELQRRLGEVALDEVAEAASQYLAPPRFTGVVVGEADRITPLLRRLSDFRVTGASG
ncbi:M16 family metallopeptidase [Nocardiopsis rhodophaea]|uniref:M16 family metallopeptidase n=1 Tax=Nocardiopsis rhodophaea TaxID=280238 RepID=UPI0031DDA67C